MTVRFLRAFAQSVAALVLLAAGHLAYAATTQYFYDELGRVVQAVRSDGSVQQYQYDASGNVTAINRVSITTVSIAGIAPSIGHAGASVTISGAGFSDVLSENTVTFSGAAQATISAASRTRLVVTVPAGAATGPVSVATTGGSATSAMSYTVRRPAIHSFAPIAVASGSPVTLTGSHLNLAPGSTTISVGGLPATITSLSNSQATVIPAAGSVHGAITVNTPYGSATSSKTLVIFASGADHIAAAETLPVNGAGPVLNVTQPNKLAVYTFSATAGQYLTVQITSLTTTPANANLSYTLYSPTGAVLAAPGNGSVSATQKSLFLPRMPVTGIYLIAFSSANASFQLSAELEQDASLAANGTSLPVATTITGQRKRFVMSAMSGDSVGLAITGVSTSPSPGTVAVSIFKPDNNLLSGGECYTYKVPGCAWHLRNVPMSGAYTVVVTPGNHQTMSFALTLSPTVTGTIAPDTTQTVNLASYGQPAALTFTAAAGQTFALHVNGIATVPASQSAAIEVRNASGVEFARFYTTTQATANLRDLPAGAYTVLVTLANAATGTVQLQFASGLTATLPADGTTSVFSSSMPGQAGYFRFSAAAGDSFGLAITNVATSPTPGTVSVVVYRPDRNIFSGAECNTYKVPGCAWTLRNLPVSGVYEVIVASSSWQTMSFALTLSAPITGTIPLGTPQPIATASPGQYAALTFTATAGQNLALIASAIATTPANKTVHFSILNASGGQIASGGSASGATINMANLSAGVYTAIISVADAATATMELTLQ